MGAAFQLSPVELRRELQVDPRGRHAPSDLLPVHPRAVRGDVQSAPIGARWAADLQERPTGGDESGRPRA
eukprot:14275565-Alexandrium_andersonii.AAC.1